MAVTRFVLFSIAGLSGTTHPITVTRVPISPRVTSSETLVSGSGE